MIALQNTPRLQWISRGGPGGSELRLVNPTDGLC
jgi:hypothetical protein